MALAYALAFLQVFLSLNLLLLIGVNIFADQAKDLIEKLMHVAGRIPGTNGGVVIISD